VSRTVGRVIIRIFVAWCCLASVSGMAGQSGIEPRTIARGAHSNVDGPRQAVVRTPAEWTALWRAHDYDTPAPAVDFSREMVVAVFMGSRPTAGYTVEIVSVKEAGGSLVVSYREQSPARDALTAQVLTAPFHIAAVPKFVGDVRFSKSS
jgi:protease stability complex PrcB-like protein